MKHLFIVHSNISYLAALGVISHQGIAPRDIVIWGANYEMETPLPCRNIRLEGISRIWKHPYRYFSQVAWVDKQIDRATQGCKFIVYIPLLLDVCRIAVTHPHCAGFHFIEEGISCYCPSFPLWNHTKKYRASNVTYRYSGIRERGTDLLRILKGYTSAMDSLPFLYNAYTATSHVGFYGFGDRPFYGVARETFTPLSFDRIRQHFAIVPRYQLDDSIILLGGSIVRTYNVTQDVYMTSIQKGVIDPIKASKQLRDRPIFIKFHQAETEESKAATRQLLQQNGMTYTEMQLDTIVELELLNARNVTLYGAESSLLFYAARMGHQVYSTIGYLPECVDRVDQPFFRDIVPLS